jgi:NitT/TauT family transport system substrate-binding protein
MSAARLQPSDIEMVFTPTAFDAAAAFNGDPSIAGAVSWAPDIYKLSEVAGNRLLVSTATANKLIADVWFARADFARDHQGKLEALVRGIFDAMEALKTDEAKQRCARLMAAGYDIPVEEVQGMFADAHSTNWAENRQFFLNRNNPTNFETVYNNAYRAYRLIGTVNHEPVPFEQIMDPSILEKLGQEDKYASQQDESRVVLQPKPLTEIRGAEADPGIVVSTFTVHFYPNSADLYKKVIREKDGQQVEELYEPEVDEVLDEIARLAGSFGIAYINISGHTDASMKGKIPETLVEELSRGRAEAVRDALLNRYRDLGPERFTVEGVGWGRPADPEQPNDHAQNRRVEVQVYPAEVE